eukprot:m.81802 g.81802  ORF g.81802 m.81802 type:complete len:219 (+) comp14581_c0_seq1:53-709(+)
MVDVVISYERQTIKTQMKPNLDLLELCDVLSLDKGQASKLKVVHKGQIVVQGQQLVNRAKLFVFASKGTIAPEWQHSFWNYLELLLSPLQALWQWLNGLWQARPLDSRAIVAATRYQAVAGSEQMIEIEVGHDFASTHQRPAILVTWKAVDCGQLVEAGVRQYLGIAVGMSCGGAKMGWGTSNIKGPPYTHKQPIVAPCVLFSQLALAYHRVLYFIVC